MKKAILIVILSFGAFASKAKGEINQVQSSSPIQIDCKKYANSVYKSWIEAGATEQLAHQQSAISKIGCIASLVQ